MTLLASVDGVKPRLALLAILLLQACGIRLSRRSDIRKLNLVHEPAAHASSGILPSALPTLRASRMPAPMMPTPIMPGQHVGGSLGPHMSRPLPQNQTRSLGAGQTGYLDDLTGRAGMVDRYMAFAGLDKLASAVKTDLQDKRQRTRSAKVWMAWDARSLGSSSEYLYDTFLEESSEYLSSTLTEAENTFVDTMGYVDATLQEFLESDDGWLVAMLINTLDMTPQKKDPLEDLQSQFIFGVRTDVIGLINRLSFVEKVRLMFKVVRESVTWVMVQKPFKRKISAVRLLIRRFTVPRDRWGKPDLSILYAGSTGEESLILRNLNDEFKGLGLQLLTELAPRLEEVAASDFRQSAPEELRWLADQTPNRRSELRKAWIWMESVGIKTFEDPRNAQAEPDVAVLLEVVTRARLFKTLGQNLRDVLPKVESTNIPRKKLIRQRNKEPKFEVTKERTNDHLFMRENGGGVENFNLLQGLASSVASELQALMPVQSDSQDDNFDPLLPLAAMQRYSLEDNFDLSQPLAAMSQRDNADDELPTF